VAAIDDIVMNTMFLPILLCFYLASVESYIPFTNLLLKHTQLSMSDDRSLMDEMAKTLGEKEDIFAAAEQEGKRLLQGLREVDKDSSMVVNKRFNEWLEKNGVYISTTSSWGRAPHPLVISSETTDDGESCGRGLLAREPINEGELLMTVPLDLCLTKTVAQSIFGSRIIPDYTDEYIAIAVLLMSEKLKGTSSNWKPYIDILPTVNDVYPSFIWSEEELDMLKGSPTYYASISLR
jgi:histone-lysine N-methyltransferase SETD3